MKIISNILRHLGLSLFVLSTAQAAQISDKERYLLSQSNIHNQYNNDEKTNHQNRLDKDFLEAAKRGDINVLKKLKKQGISMVDKNNHGNNALHLAAMYAPNGKGIEWLLNVAKLSIESEGQYGATPFLMAAEKGNLDALKILKNKGANVKAKNKYRNNALHLAACFVKDTKVIVWLIDSAKIPIESKAKNQATPFLCAAIKGNLSALKLLKDKGANVRAKNKKGKNALHLAALYAPNGKGIEWLIDTAKIDIESKGQYQKTPFLCAAEKGNLEALKILKNKGANLYATDQDGNNALHLAAMYAPNGKGIEWLIHTTKIDIESKGQYQMTPFLCAAEKGNLEALKILKNKGANLYATNQYGSNALHYAARYAPNGKGIEWLIDTAKIDIESKGNNQATPFLMAATSGNLEAFKILKNKGANLYATNQDGNNALHFAASLAPNGKGIQWLIDTAKIDIESKGQYQKTPFLIAADSGNLDALKTLKNKGANLNATDQDGNNALYQAARYAPNGKGIEWLIDTAKIDIESKGHYKKTPFLMAAEKGNLDALKILKNKGANLNATNENGNNALHLAAVYAPNGKGIEWLIDTAKIDIESKGKYKNTPFLMAAQKGNLDTLKILRNKGADVNATDKSGNNALHYAAMFAPEGKSIEWLILTAKIDTESQEGHQKTPFICAAEKGNLDALKILKNNGANVNATDNNGNNALHFAAVFAPNGKGIEWLIHTAKIDIESKGYYEMTPFLCAAEKSNLNALKLLKNKGANVNATDQYGDNAIYLAICRDVQFEIIEWLVNQADIDLEHQILWNRKTPFLMAAENGNLNLLKLLKNKGAYVNAIDQYGHNAIYFAICNNLDFQVFQWLVNHTDIDLDHQITWDQKTPFLCAAEKGNLDALKLLKKKGANVNATDKGDNNALHLAAGFAPEGKGIEWLIDTAKIDIESKGYYEMTPFLWAAKKGNLDALKLLKNKGADVNATDKHGDNALHWAIWENAPIKCIQWLIHTAKIDIDSQGYKQMTSFLYAAEKGNLGLLKFLKNKGADVNAIDKNGDNALHWAIWKNADIECIQWLIDTAKIDIESKGYKQKNSFLSAAKKGNLDVLKLLKNNGAHVFAADEDGNNALYYAKKNNDQNIIKWLQEVCGLIKEHVDNINAS